MPGAPAPLIHQKGNIVNKSQLIDAIVGKTGQSKAAVTAIVNATTEVVQEAVAAGGKVALTGFGSFEQVYKSARDARNPGTGETIKVEESWVVKFRPGSDLKEAVNEGGRKAAAEQAA